MSQRISIVGGAAAAAVCVALAWSGEAGAATRAEQFDCIWNTLPPARREQFVVAGPTVPALFRTFTRGEPGQLAKTCGLDVTSSEDQKLVSSGVVGPAILEGATRDLKARFGVDDKRLDAAWRRFPAESRENISRVFEGVQLLPATEAGLDRLGTDLGLPLDGQGVRDRLFDYAFGRSLIERYRATPAK